jgi:hypothetical protein
VNRAQLVSLTPEEIEKLAKSVHTAGPDPISSDVESLEKRAETGAAVVGMMRHHGWLALTERVAKQLEYFDAKLMTSNDMRELDMIRGQILGIKTLKIIAEQIILDAKAAAVALRDAPVIEDDEHL